MLSFMCPVSDEIGGRHQAQERNYNFEIAWTGGSVRVY